MIGIVCIVIWIVLGGLSAKAGQEEGDVFRRISSFLYDILCSRRWSVVENAGVKNDLERLYPGETTDFLNKEYYVEKFRLILLVLLAGTVLCMLMQVKYWTESGTVEEILRADVDGEATEIRLQAQVGREQEEILAEVAPRRLTKEELQEWFRRCSDELESLVTSKPEVEQTNLPERVEGYPFEIIWKNNGTGEVTAYLYYGEEMYTCSFQVEAKESLQPLPLGTQLQQAVEVKDEQTQYEDRLMLPDSLGDTEIIWKRVAEDNSGIFFLLTVMVVVGVYFLKDKDLHEELLEKRRNMQLAYPAVLNKFVLYMGAGLTVRGSFMKIAADYQGGRMPAKKGVVYEEMLYSCNELNAGVSESQVYERFGKRSGLQEYARFATMLSQNLKKGNATLLVRLREESEKAQTENLHIRKRLGEEAQTKLLIPMIMMMAIVMLLVMIPAFSSLG